MKLIKTSMMLVCTTLFVLSAVTAAATTITDGTGDVWHWSQTGTTWAWTGNVATKPNIDITQITANVNGGQLVLTMTVAGVVENTEKTGYWMYYNTTDMSYWAMWTNGYGMGFGSRPNQTMPEMATFTVSGNTITAKFNVTSVVSAQKFWGWAAQSTGTLGSNSSEWWGDWAPNTEIPFSIPTNNTGGNTTPSGNTTNGNTNNGTSTGSKTPGFEVLPVIATLAVAALLLRKRR
jgi:hypothetical protein